MALTAVPVIGKKKSSDICTDFILGAPRSAKGYVFYGVNETNAHTLQQAKSQKIDFYYIDNAYFDVTRGTHYRVSKNAIQHSGAGTSTGERFNKMRLTVSPWREAGEHVVVIEQSPSFMRAVFGYCGNWLEDTVSRLRTLTDRPVLIRPWSSDKVKLAGTLGADLEQAWALVTHSSAAAITALLHGVPIVAESGAATSMSASLLSIDRPTLPRDRHRFFSVLADNQWTTEELRSGLAWQTLNPA